MKYKLVCKKCGHEIDSFATWFKDDQKCCKCGSGYAEVQYPEADYSKLKELTKGEAENFYKYFDFLPIEHRENVVTCGEGAIPMERWEHMEKCAKDKYGIDCKVWMYRNDLNGGTGTFKDVSASLAASAMKENGIKEYCLASTGNAGLAYATYLAKAGVKFTCFSPSFVDPKTIERMRATGQNIVVSKGNYGDAKAEAANYHKENKVLMSPGNIDPLRVDSKRTIVFECLRQIGYVPSVYMQAVAGGTSPIALYKGVKEIQPTFPEVKMPRMLLVQQDECDPMVNAWEWATENNFPEGFENHYEAKKNVKTRIGILTAANPGNYPIVAPMVKESKGTFLRVKEAELPSYGKQMKEQTGVLMGPASLVCYAGFYRALEKGLIKNGDSVLLNCGEGTKCSQWFVDEVEKLK